jgi:hypothetical protein
MNMAEDFRTLLKEEMRDSSSGERWFADIEIGDAFYLSIQASTLHGSNPPELLEDLSAYKGFQVIVQSKHGVFVHGKRGAWQYLMDKPWWSLFEEDTQILYQADNVPAPTVQQIYEDMLACAEAHPEVVIKKKCLQSVQ